MQQPILPIRCLTGRVFKPSIFRTVRSRQCNSRKCLAMGRSPCTQTTPAHSYWPTESLTDDEFLSAWDKWRTNLNADATPAPCPPTAACTAASTRCLVPKPTAPRTASNGRCWTVRQNADRAAPVAASTNSWPGKQHCTTTWATNELAKYFKPKPHHPLPHLVHKPLATVTDPLSLN